MIGEQTVIAVEEHWDLPAATAALRARPAGLRDDALVLSEHGDLAARLDDLGDARIADMDAQGVDVQVLSPANPPGTGALPAAEAVPLCRDANDAAAEAVRRHPTRFRAFATLPVVAPAVAADELRRAARLGLVGAVVHGRAADVPLDDPRHDELFATAEALGLPLFLHPGPPARDVREAACSGLGDAVGLGLATYGWGWHVDAGTAALRLVLRGTFDRFPGLRLVLGHWGELLPFWLSRADSLSAAAGLPRTVSEYVRSHVHLTCSGMLEPALLRHVLAVTAADRLLFSTDHPFQRPTAGEIARFLGEFADEADRRRFCSGNAAELLGIGGPAAA
ncbi:MULTISPECIES: amidohydrolase family protein [unclassified Saccharopolyspora]|uniref:amidohydrolase family protein n=1 Tax=unclassified Saccharopolyspora TaxID=2646250 RepID=UPI001CD35948|nr:MULTISPECIES: amidohydrolase family protein [unclassified Saccharopolyspora]MCA1184895.1 amidohydrolase family protein [Saccharopolyspora sp. 6T]MCA1190619.1 amidohydrolase family protein [Saccharopolyspora sp. 6V]MCA1226489.1 amidohydrolase family protein [Saccharopolyspora sp. 6M]MCA1279939.1 amidohydrolase family protein [Saccharopolyspora sp. 7B]